MKVISKKFYFYIIVASALKRPPAQLWLSKHFCLSSKAMEIFDVLLIDRRDTLHISSADVADMWHARITG